MAILINIVYQNKLIISPSQINSQTPSPQLIPSPQITSPMPTQISSQSSSQSPLPTQIPSQSSSQSPVPTQNSVDEFYYTKSMFIIGFICFEI